LNKFGRIALKTILWIIGSVIALLLLAIFLIRLPSVQNYVVGKVTNYVENKIGTPVKIGYIKIEFPKNLVLQNVYLEDQTKDTLVATEELKVDISMLKLLKNTVEIQEISLKGATAKISRSLPDSAFNFDYIVNAFASEKESTPTADTSSAMLFNIEKVNLDKIRFVYKDDVIGTSAEINLQHFDTRIKTFDLTKNMTFDMPTVNIDGLQAIVRQWAPMTAANAPKAADFGITDQSVKEAELLPNVGIKTANLKNIKVRYSDSSSAMDTHFDIKTLLANIHQIDLNKEIVTLDDIALDGSDSEVIFGKLAKAKSDQTTSDKTTADSTASNNWIVSANEIVINKTNFLFRDDNQARMKGFDYGNIKIQNLNGNLENLYYSTDSLSGALNSLSAKDHSGFEIKQIKGDFVYTNTGATIENLYAETPNTLIRDYIKISYPSLDIVSTKPETLVLDANIRKSHLGMKDIKFFAPFLDTMQVMKPLMTKTFFIDGRVKGKMNDLQVPSLEFKTLNRTHIIASAHIKGLPDVDKMNINLKLKKLTTGRKDLEQLIAKSMLPDSIQLPTSIGLTGTFNGGMKGFDADLALKTEQGNAFFDGKLNMAGRDTTYDARVRIEDFNIGSILKMDSTLGVVAFDADVSGHGLNPKTMEADVKGTLLRLDAMGYKYQNIGLNLSASKGDIKATVSSDDPNLDLDLKASADMQSQYPKVQMEMMIDSINLKNLKLMNEDLRYHGKIVADFETADLNFLNGRIDIINSSIAYNNDRFVLDSVSLVAKADTSRNQLMLQSEFLKAHLVGKYKLTELGAAMQDILRIYYQPNANPTVIPPYSPQNFEFSAQLNNSRFIRDFFPDLEELRPVTIDGTFDSQTKSILAKLVAPKITYAGTKIEDVSLDINTVDSTMYYSTLINKIAVSNIELLNTVLSGKVIQNNVDLGLWIKDKKDKEQYYLGAKMKVNDDNYILSLLENGLMLNYETWHIAEGNGLSFGKDGIRAQDFILSNKGQELKIVSQDSSFNSPINLTFNNFRIETFSQMLESEILDLDGGINGSATISRLDSKPVFVSDLTIDKFFFGKDTVGNVSIKVNNEIENTYAADIRITENGNDVQLLGEYISPPDEKSRFNATLDLRPLRMKTVEAFSLGYLQRTEGNLEGKLDISGTVDDPHIKGDLVFQDARLNVTMLNADFYMNGQTISFNDAGLAFRDFQIKDKRGNMAKINGSIATKDYTDFDFNLNVNTDDFTVVNSTREDNDLFYGKLFVTSALRIRGDMHKPVVDGNIKANDKTEFVFIVPNDNPGMVQRDGVVKFVNKSDTSAANVFAKLDSMTTTSHLSGIDLTLNLQTDKEAKFKIIMDEGSKDALNIQGTAELNMGIDASEKITMSGTFTVEKGNYSFSFGPISKEFDFQKGSTITWNGDPLDAQLGITALYKNKFPTLELVQNQIGTESANLYKQRVPFDVKLLLTGELFKPAINFDIDLDEKNAIVSQDVVSKVNNALTALREDQSELNKQVFSLIILGRFMASNPFESLSGGGGLEGTARNTMSSFLSGQLNALASDLIKGVELDFGLESSQDYLTGSGDTRTDLNIGVSKMLFDDRLKITIGSNFEVEGGSRPGEQANNIAGDISLDYQLSQDGRYFARVYRKNQYQATLQGQFVETGIGFIINMDYNKFREIFMNTKQLQQYYDTDSKGFRRRFDVDRMNTDSVYRDSVRTVIRDSLMLHSPEYRKRQEEKLKEQEKLKKDSLQGTSKQNSVPKPTDTARFVIRSEEVERRPNEN